MPVCGFAAVKTLEKINAHKIQRLYFTEERAPLFGGLCKKMAAAKKPYNKVQDPEELEKLSGTVHHQGVVAMITPPEILPLKLRTQPTSARQLHYDFQQSKLLPSSSQRQPPPFYRLVLLYEYL